MIVWILRLTKYPVPQSRLLMSMQAGLRLTTGNMSVPLKLWFFAAILVRSRALQKDPAQNLLNNQNNPPSQSSPKSKKKLHPLALQTTLLLAAATVVVASVFQRR